MNYEEEFPSLQKLIFPIRTPTGHPNDNEITIDCVNIQEAAAFALSLNDEYYKWLGDFYQNARDSLYNALNNTNLQPIKPHGAYYIMTNCNEYMGQNDLQNSLDLALHLIKNVGIATVPGSSFYADPKEGQFQTRFCFCKKEETLKAAAMNLKDISK